MQGCKRRGGGGGGRGGEIVIKKNKKKSTYGPSWWLRKTKTKQRLQFVLCILNNIVPALMQSILGHFIRAVSADRLIWTTVTVEIHWNDGDKMKTA